MRLQCVLDALAASFFHISAHRLHDAGTILVSSNLLWWQLLLCCCLLVEIELHVGRSELLLLMLLVVVVQLHVVDRVLLKLYEHVDVGHKLTQRQVGVKVVRVLEHLFDNRIEVHALLLLLELHLFVYVARRVRAPLERARAVDEEHHANAEHRERRHHILVLLGHVTQLAVLEHLVALRAVCAGAIERRVRTTPVSPRPSTRAHELCTAHPALLRRVVLAEREDAEPFRERRDEVDRRCRLVALATVLSVVVVVCECV